MSIEKFKNPEAAARALWCFEADSEYYRKVAALFKLGGRICGVVSERGVHKYRSISDVRRSTSGSGFVE